MILRVSLSGPERLSACAVALCLRDGFVELDGREVWLLGCADICLLPCPMEAGLNGASVNDLTSIYKIKIIFITKTNMSMPCSRVTK